MKAQVCLIYLAMQDVVGLCDDALSGISSMNESAKAKSFYLELSASCLIRQTAPCVQDSSPDRIQRIPKHPCKSVRLPPPYQQLPLH